MTESILRGREAIKNFMEVKSWNTIRKWKKIGLPILVGPDGKPIALPSELREWLAIYSKKIKKNKNS